MCGSLAAFGIAALLSTTSLVAQVSAPKAPVIPSADGYVAIPNAAIPPDRGHTYRAIFDASQGAAKPTEILPALNAAGSELNAFAVAGVPRSNVKFAVVFHGPALEGLLNDLRYQAKFGVSNPNLAVLDQLRRAGVELFACGQNLVSAHIDRSSLSPTIVVASDALIVLMEYHNRGYALLSF
jgi:intracellular sulfur oxidation DsrE/DsrF family protein